MSTSVTGTTSYWKTPTTTETSSTAGTNNLADFESFLKLLATELQNQDPSEPVSSTEYVSQMAQMSSLMQLQNIGASVDASQAYSMIGKTATYEATDSTTGDTVTGSGTVQSVSISGSSVYVTVGGTKVELSSIISVTDAADSTSA